MNDRKYWMKRRRYGWGWTPITWQGWLFTIFQVALLFLAASQLPVKPIQPSIDQILKLIATLILVVSSLLLVGCQTAPKPHWRWGKKASDNPNEDF